MSKAVHILAAEWACRKNNKEVHYMSNNSTAQFIKHMIYLKKPNPEIADNMRSCHCRRWMLPFLSDIYRTY